MFTGIIEETGTVKSVEKRGTSGRITVVAEKCVQGIKDGDSVAVDGACLTVVAIGPGSFTADLSEETLKTTTLTGLKSGDRVNLEKALTLSSPIGGHLVTGHIDGMGTIVRKTQQGGYVELEVDVPAPLLSQMVKKGSVALDGISLTIAGLTPGGFWAAVIPHTLKLTTLDGKTEGGKVNIETDIIAKYVERFLKGGGTGGITEGFLAKHGFLKSGDQR
jgi:riboflavin synthase